MLLSELFGTSEDESEEFDHSADADNGKHLWSSNVSQASYNPEAAAEIANLRKEAQALKAIRESMGSPEFYQKVFEKVFKEDIERLRGMEDMWKSRTAPQPLDFEKLQQESSSIEPIISVNDQKVWSSAEDFVVFKDRFERPSLMTILHEQ